MSESVAQAYQGIRPYLFSVAYRFTGSASEAEDLVHDAWLRYIDAGSPAVDSLRAYLTTIVSRLSLDYLKSARRRREHYVGPWLPEPMVTTSTAHDPALAWEERESISMALLVLLDHLTPTQRIAYVLRESLNLSFEEIGQHLDASAATCRQHVRRARARLASLEPSLQTATTAPSNLADRFVHALQRADIPALSALLANEVTWISDGGAERAAARNPIHGRDRVSRGLAGIVSRFGNHTARFSIESINGQPGIVMWRDDAIATVIQWQTADNTIANLWFSRNPAKLDHLARQLGVDIAPP